jgi:hypothetical protein
MYEISFDEQTRILMLKLSGFWDLAMVQRYMVDVTAEAERSERRFGAFSILTDNSDFPVQSFEVMNALIAFTKNAMERHRDQRVAITVSSALSKMQVMRVSDGPNVRIFNDRAAAIGWLTQSKVGDASD